MRATKIIGLALLAALTSSSFALSGDKQISAALNPGQSFKLPLNTLYSGVEYSLSCIFINENYETNKSSAVELISDKKVSADITRNGYTYNTTTDHVVTDFNGKDAKITVKPVINSSAITIRNLDFSYNMLVNCTAVVSRS